MRSVRSGVLMFVGLLLPISGHVRASTQLEIIAPECDGFWLVELPEMGVGLNGLATPEMEIRLQSRQRGGMFMSGVQADRIGELMGLWDCFGAGAGFYERLSGSGIAAALLGSVAEVRDRILQMPNPGNVALAFAQWIESALAYMHSDGRYLPLGSGDRLTCTIRGDVDLRTIPFIRLHYVMVDWRSLAAERVSWQYNLRQQCLITHRDEPFDSLADLAGHPDATLLQFIFGDRRTPARRWAILTLDLEDGLSSWNTLFGNCLAPDLQGLRERNTRDGLVGVTRESSSRGEFQLPCGWRDETFAGRWTGTCMVDDPSNRGWKTYQLTLDLDRRRAESSGCQGGAGIVTVGEDGYLMIDWPRCGRERVRLWMNGPSLTGEGQQVAYSDGRTIPSRWTLTRR